MNDARHDLARDLGREAMTAGAKLTAGPGVLAYGAWTLNDLALLIGILASAAIFIHTALKIVWDWRDRRAARGDR